MRHKNQTELGKLTREYDERMLTLMRQLPPCGLIESADHKVNKEPLEAFSSRFLSFFFSLTNFICYSR